MFRAHLHAGDIGLGITVGSPQGRFGDFKSGAKEGTEEQTPLGHAACQHAVAAASAAAVATAAAIAGNRKNSEASPPLLALALPLETACRAAGLVSAGPRLLLHREWYSNAGVLPKVLRSGLHRRLTHFAAAAALPERTQVPQPGCSKFCCQRRLTRC